MSNSTVNKELFIVYMINRNPTFPEGIDSNFFHDLQSSITETTNQNETRFNIQT